jgi:hypothetical protein
VCQTLAKTGSSRSIFAAEVPSSHVVFFSGRQADF